MHPLTVCFGINKGEAPRGEVGVGVGVREGPEGVRAKLELQSVFGLQDCPALEVERRALYRLARFSLASSCTNSRHFSLREALSSLICSKNYHIDCNCAEPLHALSASP